MSLEKLLEKLFESLINFGPAAIFLALAAHEVYLYLDPDKQGSLKLAIILAVSGSLLGSLLRFFLKIGEKVQEVSSTSIADWLIESFGRLKLRLADRFQREYYEDLADDCSGYKTQGPKRIEPVVLDLAKVFVPLKVAPETLERVSTAIISRKRSLKDLRIWSFLAQASQLDDYRRIAIIGPPGSGKSTMLEHLALTYARNIQRRQHPKAPKLIPILLRLRDRTVQDPIVSEDPPDLATLIHNQLWIQELKPQANWFKARLDQGKCLVMLDGLDEVADLAQRQRVSQWVNEQMRGCPSPFIITSRPYGYRSAPVERVNVLLEVKPLSLSQIKEFLHNWYLQTELYRNLPRQGGKFGKISRVIQREAKHQAQDLIDRIKHNPSLSSMAVNPLLLRMISYVHYYTGALPGRRVELYSEICEVLLGRRQAAKQLTTPLTAQQQQRILQALALGLNQANETKFTPDEGAPLIQERFQAVVGKSVDASRFFKEVDDLTGLLVEREKGTYQFAHKSFQEYLAAVEIKEQPEYLYLLKENLESPWWEETIRLYAAAKDANLIVQEALERKNASALAIAYECITTEAAEISPELREQLEGYIEGGLDSEKSSDFLLAASVLLTNRLKKLTRIDENHEIDQKYITVAEYQLFEQEQLGKTPTRVG